MNRNLEAQTQLLEAQTELLRYQLQQQQRTDRASRSQPRQRVLSDEDRRAAQKRLVKRYTQQHQVVPSKPKYRNEFDVMVEIVRLGVLDAKTALSRYAKHRPPQSVARLRDALEKANLLKPPQPHSDFIHHTNTTDITLP